MSARHRARKPEIPEAFRQLGLMFEVHTDTGSFEPFEPITCEADLDPVATILATGQGEANSRSLRAYLAEIVQPAYSDEDLARLWRATGGNVRLEGPGLRVLLRRVHDKLGIGRLRGGYKPVSEGRTHGRRVSAPRGSKR